MSDEKDKEASIQKLSGITIYKSFDDMFRGVRSTLEKRHYAAHAKLKKKMTDGNRRKG